MSCKPPAGPAAPAAAFGGRVRCPGRRRRRVQESRPCTT